MGALVLNGKNFKIKPVIMTNKEKVSILKIAAQLVYKCSEHTPPSVKESKLNAQVAKAALSIDGVIKHLKSKK